jgi:NAD-dependent SIR2 family protein deacetylase
MKRYYASELTNPEKIPPRVIFLLGAGASVDADLPTVRALIERFETQVSKRRSLRRAFELVRDHLQDNFPPLADGKAILDIELLLETIRLLRYREDSPLSAFVHTWRANVRDIDRALGDLEDELRAFVRDQCTVDPEKVQYLWPIRDFVRNYGNVDIFTLNYDAAIEIVCQQQEMRYTDGFDSYWNPAQFDSPGYDLRLFKIHGSLLWYKTSGSSSSIVKIPISPDRNYQVRLFTNEDVSELLLYPAFSKEQHVEPYSTLLSRLKEALDACELLIAVGCSFRDSYLKQLIIERMRQNRRLQVIVVDPDASNVLRWSDSALPGDWRFESVAERLVLTNLTARDALAERRLLDSARAVIDLATLEDEYSRAVWAGRAQDAADTAEGFWQAVLDTRHVGKFMAVVRGDPNELGSHLVRKITQSKNNDERLRYYPAAVVAAVYAPSREYQTLLADWVVNSTHELLEQVVWKSGNSYLTNKSTHTRGGDPKQFFEVRAERTRTLAAAMEGWAKQLTFQVPGLATDFQALFEDIAKVHEYFAEALSANRHSMFTPWTDKDRASFPRSINEPLMVNLGTRFDVILRLPHSLKRLLHLT